MKVYWFAIWVVINASSWGYLASYAPFEPEQRPPLFPVQKCLLRNGTDPNQTGKTYTCQAGEDSQTPELHIACLKEAGILVGWIEESDDFLCLPHVLSDCSPAAPDVYHADLNGDELEDFIVIAWSRGCGLGAIKASVTFFLSSLGRYTPFTVLDYNPGPHCFVDINKTGKPAYLYTQLIDSPDGKDGKPHNYWVYNLLAFRDDQCLINNEPSPLFPTWIWYTYKDNHRETQLLTQAQKETLWTQQAPTVFLEPTASQIVHLKESLHFRKDLFANCETDLQTSGPFKILTSRIWGIGGAIDLIQDDRLVFHRDGHAFYIGGHEILRTPIIEPGTDITGDGKPNLVFYEWSGGVHCCYTATVLELADPIKTIAVIEGFHSEPIFKDMDGDGVYEVMLNDWTYEYWPDCFAGSPAPHVVLKFENGQYAVAAEFMIHPAPTKEEFEKCLSRIQPDSLYHSSTASQIFRQALDLMYTGHEQLGWEFIDKAWPKDDAETNVKYTAELKELMARSPYWTPFKKQLK